MLQGWSHSTKGSAALLSSSQPRFHGKKPGQNQNPSAERLSPPWGEHFGDGDTARAQRARWGYSVQSIGICNPYEPNTILSKVSQSTKLLLAVLQTSSRSCPAHKSAWLHHAALTARLIYLGTTQGVSRLTIIALPNYLTAQIAALSLEVISDSSIKQQQQQNYHRRDNCKLIKSLRPG